MLAGPVAHFELVRIARKRRTFVLRFLFGLVVLGVVAVDYTLVSDGNRPWFDPGSVSIGEMAWFGRSLFWAVMTAQAVLVLCLTPALVADAIASERQSKTPHDLLTTRLGGGEIVVGKLAARLVSVAAFPALVLPVMSLIAMIGGVSPAGLFLGDAALAATAFFLGALAMLASILARRPRDAVGAAYLLAAVWLFLPPVVTTILDALPGPGPETGHTVREALGWVWPASPLELVTDIAAVLGGGADEVWRRTTWMIGSEVAYGALFVALAAWRLRPSFRRHESRSGVATRSARLARRMFPVPPCGDDPIYWKKAVFNPAVGGLGRRLARLGRAGLLCLIVVGTLFAAKDAFREVRLHGYGSSDEANYSERIAFNMAIRYGGAVLFGVWVLWLGGVAAASITSEREQDTWLGLLATPLDGSDILRGKQRAAFRTTADFGVALVALWLIGLVVGSVHPLGLIAAVAVTGLMAWFVAALGLYSSLKMKATWRARALTQGLVIAPHLCCLIPLPSVLYLVGLSLWSYVEVREAFRGTWRTDAMGGLVYYFAAYYVGGLALYGASAYFLTRGAFRGFDAAADRPRHIKASGPPPPGWGDGPSPSPGPRGVNDPRPAAPPPT